MEKTQSRMPLWEIVVSAVVLLVGVFGIGTAAYGRVDKGSGALTMENYPEFLQISCESVSGVGAGSTMTFRYTVTVRAEENYAIEGLTLSYTLTGGGVSLSSTLRADLAAGGVHTETNSAEAASDSLWVPDFQVTVTAVSGTYRYAE